MTLAVGVGGLRSLEDLTRRLKDADRADLRKELLRGIRAGAKPILQAQKRELAGLRRAPSDWQSEIGKRTQLSVRLSGNPRVRIKGPSKEPMRRYGRYLNTGRWRHPLFGNKEHWFPQTVRRGWFDRPPEGGAPHVRRELQQVLADIAAKLEG